MTYRFEAAQTGFPSAQPRLLKLFHGDIATCLRRRDRRALLSALEEQADTFESRVANALIHGHPIETPDYSTIRDKRGSAPGEG